MKTLQQLSVILILIVGSTGSASAQKCKNWYDTCVLTSYDVSNSTAEDAIVYFRLSTKADETIWTTEIKIPKGEAKVINGEPFNAVPGAKLTWQYSVASLDARFDLPSREVRNTPGTQSFTQTLRAIERYNDTVASVAIAKIASDLKLQTTATPLKNSEKELGTVWLGNTDGTQRGASWSLKRIEVVADGVIKLKKSISIKGETATKATVTIPLLSTLTASLEQSSLYWMEWVAEHFGYQNTTIAADMFSESSASTIRSVIATLTSSADAYVCYVGRAHIIKFLSHAVTKGRKQNATGSAMYSSLFVADGLYVFDAQDTELTTMTDQVVDRQYNCIPKEQVLRLAQARLLELEPVKTTPATNPAPAIASGG